MKSTFKAVTLALISLVSTVIATTGSALADDRMNPNQPTTPIKVSTPIGCSLESSKEFKQAVVINNTTNQTIAAGKVVSVRVYYYGKIQGKQAKYTLTQPLASGQSIKTGQDVSSETSANYICKAAY
jgi:hypothetical protein